MTGIDIDYLKTWIGNRAGEEDMATPLLVKRFRATFGDHLYDTGSAAPLGLHWCLALPIVETSALAPDGHIPKGGFLPPVPLPRRMWAGGDVSFHAPLPVGVPIRRLSEITDVAQKTGRSGVLVFVAVRHDYFSGDELLISETHNIVYREAGAAGQPADLLEVEEAPPGFISADPALLFRYSALTFNSHRIHYDLRYVREQRSYPDLVVHGPLQATLLMNQVAKRLGSTGFHFRYRGLSPLFAGQPFTLVLEAGEKFAFCKNTSGNRTMEAQFKAL